MFDYYEKISMTEYFILKVSWYCVYFSLYSVFISLAIFASPNINIPLYTGKITLKASYVDNVKLPYTVQLISPQVKN